MQVTENSTKIAVRVQEIGTTKLYVSKKLELKPTTMPEIPREYSRMSMVVGVVRVKIRYKKYYWLSFEFLLHPPSYTKSNS